MGTPEDDRSAGLRAVAERLRNKAPKTLPTSRLSRSWGASRALMESGGKLLADRIRGQAPALDAALAERIATRMAGMRGLALKVGQMMSYVDPNLPEEARRILALLQQDVPPMPWSDIQSVFEESFGSTPEAVFDDFDTTPLAAASIGQVHRATLPTGEKVAVKLQYPGIADAMQADLKNARWLNLLSGSVFTNVDAKAIMAELEARFLEECDYRIEAQNQDDYRGQLAHHPDIHVPAVYPKLSSARVLTTEFCEGRTLQTWLDDEPDQQARNHAALAFYRFYIGSFYLHGIFNGDPHPGNYVFRPDGRISFLDYGCCRRFPRSSVARWIRVARAVRGGDPFEMEQAAIDVGFLRAGQDYDRPAFAELMAYLYQFYLEDRLFDFRSEHAPQETFRRQFLKNPNLMKLNMPAESVFLNRISFGLVSILASMGAALRCQRINDAYFEGRDPPLAELQFGEDRTL